MRVFVPTHNVTDLVRLLSDHSKAGAWGGPVYCYKSAEGYRISTEKDITFNVELGCTTLYYPEFDIVKYHD